MTKLTKAEFDALPESLKTKFKAEGEDYVLIEEDVDGLKKSKAEILEEKKRIQAERDELAKFKAEKEAEAQKAAEADLEKKGEYDKLLAEKEKAWNERLEQLQASSDALLGDVKRERLTNELVKRGVLADRAAYLVNDLDAEIELVKGDTGYQLKKKGGIGDAAEFDAMIAGVKEKTPFFFASNGASGSGASGSGNGGGNAKTMTRTAFDSMDPAAQMAFSKDGGTLTD